MPRTQRIPFLKHYVILLVICNHCDIRRVGSRSSTNSLPTVAWQSGTPNTTLLTTVRPWLAMGVSSTSLRYLKKKICYLSVTVNRLRCAISATYNFQFTITILMESWLAVVTPRSCGSLWYVSGKLPTYPSLKPTFCPKWEVSFADGSGKGWVGSFPET